MINPNGRVDILQPNTNTLFSMFDKIPANDCVSYKDAMQGNWTDSPLSKAFFSKQNFQIIQNGLRAGVYKMSNNRFVIGQQSCDNLKMIMRSIFLQHSANMPDNIPEQINGLNNLVLEYSIPKLFSEATAYLKYKHDASTLVVPLSRPVLAYSNDKTLELKPCF